MLPLPAVLADFDTKIADALADLVADPTVAARMEARMRVPVAPLTLTVVREVVERHNRNRGAAWLPDDAAVLLLWHGDLVHDMELVQRLLAVPNCVGTPKLLREDRFTS